MVVTLIPVPAVIAHPQQLMADQRIAAVHPQVLSEVGLHQQPARPRAVARGTQIPVIRFGKRTMFIDPLPGFAVIFAKTHAEGVGRDSPGDNGPAEQYRVDITAQLDIVGDAPGAGSVERRSAIQIPSCAATSGKRVVIVGSSGCMVGGGQGRPVCRQPVIARR